MSKTIITNIWFSLGTIVISAVVSFWFATRISRISHQQQLRAEKIEEILKRFYQLKDMILIVGQQVQQQYFNLIEKRAVLLDDINTELLNSVLTKASELNSITNLHGPLFGIEIFRYEDVLPSHRAILDLFYELNRVKDDSSYHHEIESSIKSMYEGMESETSKINSLLLDYAKSIQEKYHKDTK